MASHWPRLNSSDNGSTERLVSDSCGAFRKIVRVFIFSTVEAQKTSALIRAFNRAHKDVVERLSGVDFAPISPEEASATWERTEREILLETNRKHDWEHRKSPWFRLYYHFY
jgi:hypothetical protein